MNKSNLRKEYEARMGVVEGSLCLYNERGEGVYYEYANGDWSMSEYNERVWTGAYYEYANGSWSRYEYNKAGKEVYYESSSGIIRDNRPPKAKTFKEENGIQYKLVEITK